MSKTQRWYIYKKDIAFLSYVHRPHYIFEFDSRFYKLMFYFILYTKDIDIITLPIVLSCMFFLEVHVCTEADCGPHRKHLMELHLSWRDKYPSCNKFKLCRFDLDLWPFDPKINRSHMQYNHVWSTCTIILCQKERITMHKGCKVQIWPLTSWPEINRGAPQVTGNTCVKYHHRQ